MRVATRRSVHGFLFLSDTALWIFRWVFIHNEVLSPTKTCPHLCACCKVGCQKFTRHRIWRQRLGTCTRSPGQTRPFDQTRPATTTTGGSNGATSEEEEIARLCASSELREISSPRERPAALVTQYRKHIRTVSRVLHVSRSALGRGLHAASDGRSRFRNGRAKALRASEEHALAKKSGGEDETHLSLRVRDALGEVSLRSPDLCSWNHLPSMGV